MMPLSRHTYRKKIRCMLPTYLYFLKDLVPSFLLRTVPQQMSNGTYQGPGDQVDNN